MVRLGIDPGYRTGVVALNREGGGDWEIVEAKTFAAKYALAGIRRMAETHDAREFYVQVPAGSGKFARWSPSMAGLVRHAQFAGIVVGFCRGLRRGFVFEVPPSRGTGLKMARDLWRIAWRWTGRLPSEHARDAAMIALSQREPR